MNNNVAVVRRYRLPKVFEVQPVVIPLTFPSTVPKLL
jgi:hypothetical protein